MNVTLKSGTNSLKGSGYTYYRSEKLAETDFFLQRAVAEKPKLGYKRPGFTLGGPIRKSRVFFFGDYQHTRDHAGRSQLATIPPMAFRTGDFSAASTRIYDPATGNPDGTGRQQFPDNIIPANRISPHIARMSVVLPDPFGPSR